LPRKHERVVELLLLLLVILLILIVIWIYFILQNITPGKAAVETALNFT
jgi:uncharacterized protein (UPF0333 family)